MDILHVKRNRLVRMNYLGIIDKDIVNRLPGTKTLGVGKDFHLTLLLVANVYMQFMLILGSVLIVEIYYLCVNYVTNADVDI